MQLTAFWWAALTAIIWGVVPLLEKTGLRSSDPGVGLFARSIGVALGAFVVGLWWRPWQALGSLSPQSFTLLALGGFLASFVGQLAFYHALKIGTLSQVTPVSGTYPLVASLLGWWLLHEPMTFTRVLGVAFVVVGIILLRR